MVFLSGWGLSSDFWSYTISDLTEQGVRCVAYDRRGHGRSDDPGQGYDFDTLAEDLASVMDELDVKDATLVGYSMGGGEAVRYISKYGTTRVKRLVLVGALTPFLTRTADNLEGLPAEVFMSQRTIIAADFPKWLAGGEEAYWGGAGSAELRAWGRSLMYQTALPVLLACNSIVTSTDFRSEMKKLTLPTLILHGDKDASAPLPLTGQRTANVIPGAILKVYQDAPHGLPLTHSTRFNADLFDFN